MIKGVHTMFYSSQVEELRAFIRDKLQFSFSVLSDGGKVNGLILKSK